MSSFKQKYKILVISIKKKEKEGFMFRTVDNIKYIYNNTIYCTVCNIHQNWATHFSSVFFLNLSISPAKLSKIIFETLCIFGSKLFYGQLISDSKALGFSKSSDWHKNWPIFLLYIGITKTLTYFWGAKLLFSDNLSVLTLYFII